MLAGHSGSLHSWLRTTGGLLGSEFIRLRLGGCGGLLVGRCGLLLVGMRLLGVWITSRRK